jgi:hypothetical protein
MSAAMPAAIHERIVFSLVLRGDVIRKSRRTERLVIRC